MARRPHLSKTLKELTAIVDKRGVTASELAEVAHELTHRKSGSAKRLLKRITGSAVTGDKTTAGTKGKKKSRGSAKSTGSPSDQAFTPVVIPDLGPEARDAIERLKVLRETYSEGAELLARWGATTALPDDLLNVLFSTWAKVVTDKPDEFGRSRTTLQQDMERWKLLRSGILNEGKNE